MLKRAVTEVKHECPMCGEFMRLVERTQVDRIPGTSQVATRKMMEWVCPECDYFEEHVAEEGEPGGGGPTRG